MRLEMNSREMTGAQYIAETLSQFGVDHVFYVLAILRRSLVEMERVGINRVLVHSEKSGVYMADGYARATGKPGVMMAQSVGAANLAAGLQDPFLNHSPVLAITGRKQPMLQYRNAYQELTHRDRIYDPVTKFDANVDEVHQLPGLLSQAFRELTTMVPRPVHLELLGLAGELVECEKATLVTDVDTRYSAVPAVRIVPDEAEVIAVMEEISRAQRPILVAGKGVYDSDARKEFRALVEKLQVPVAVTCDGKGIIPDNHTLCVGIAGAYGCLGANRVISRADLVVFVGSGVSDQTTFEWTVPSQPTRVIQIDINPPEIGRNYPNSIGVVGDARLTLKRMLMTLSGSRSGGNWSEWLRNAQDTAAEWRREYEPMRTSEAIPIRPERLCAEIEKMLPENAILVADTGYSAQWSATMLNLNHPEQRFMRAAGSLGWAFPASIGAKLGRPELPVICFCGDGALWYHIAELETAVRCGANVITVVNNNSAFGQSRKGMYTAYGDNPGDKDRSYSFHPVNFANIAREIGCTGIRVESPEGIRGAFRQALKSNKPVLIDVVTDPTCAAPAAWE